MKNILAYLLCFFAIFFSGIIICKNTLFYSNEYSYTYQCTSENMLSYTYDSNENIFKPLDESARFELHDALGKVNYICVEIQDGLPKDSVVTLYNSSSNVDEYVIEKKEIRKGYKKVSFYFKDLDLDGIKILFQSYEGNKLLDISNAEIKIELRTTNILQRNRKYILTVCCIFFVSILLTSIIIYGSKQPFGKSKKRDSNLELLRIISMILLVAHHYAVHGGLLWQPFSKTKYLGLIFLPIGKICFIAFIAISMYFLVDGENKTERFIMCWLEVAFYSVTLTILTWCLGGIVNYKDLISSFFVMTGNSHGFAASYLLFLLIYPFILKATKNCTKKQAFFLLFLTFSIQIFSQILKAFEGYDQPVHSELTLFVFCYFLSMCLKRYPIEIINNKLFDLLIVILIWVYVFVIYLVDYSGACYGVTRFLRDITNDESSLIYIIGGYSLFYLFKNLRIQYNKIINMIAKCCFGVLLIHDHNFLRHIFWNDIVRTQLFFETKNLYVIFIIEVFMVFFACSVLDFIRQKVLEKKIIKTPFYTGIVNKLNEVFDDEIKE